MQKKILIVDDEELLTRTFVILLKKKGYDVFFVKGGDDAVEIVEEVDFEKGNHRGVCSDVEFRSMVGAATVLDVNNGIKRRRPL